MPTRVAAKNTLLCRYMVPRMQSASLQAVPDDGLAAKPGA